MRWSLARRISPRANFWRKSNVRHAINRRHKRRSLTSLLAFSVMARSATPEAIAACRAALERRPSYAEAWNNICAAYNKLGRYEEAAAACEQALRYKADLQLARNNLQYARDMAKASTP